MVATIETPDGAEPCGYCGSDIFAHDPICVRECTDNCGSPSYFCIYGCLPAYTDENELASGDAFGWTPE